MKTQYILYLSILSVLVHLSGSIHAKSECPSSSKKPQSKLLCYYSKLEEINGCFCSHVILPPNSDVKGIERVKKDVAGVKIYVSVYEFNEGLINLLKSSKVDGLEVNLRKFDSKNDIADFISTVKTKLGADLDILLSVPSKAELVAKYFDFKALSKNVDMFILQTAFLGASVNVTFHPSRLSGMWDMQNTDSVVDLVTGLGAPLSKLVITAPVQGFHFTLQNENYTAPGSPALELRTLSREQLCKKMNNGGNWTLERDEDQAGPYIFSQNDWIAFEDEKSIDIKTKYSRIRGLAGIALKDLSLDDGPDSCGPSILEATYQGLSRQGRAPRGAVLHSLEREFLQNTEKSSQSVHLSPFRISRVIDTEGKIHVVRQDSRTEFQCSRQGYFVHPRSCNRFYRCVKFNQQTEDFNVFEFDCPAGLAFDERVEVCVWPGSLPHGTPCSGSSEIAPVPKTRFECPSEPGYYADPENCRWFFACLDHGKSPLTAYEFRCPFGLAFDGDRLVCEWPWMVPKCASTGISEGQYDYYGGDGLGYNQYSLGGQGFQGTISPGIVLQNYDGLGQLGAIKLGGLPAGTYEHPISKVYSTAGTANGFGYQNNGGYIAGNGLGYNAVQSLHNAGLLKVNNGAGLSYNTAPSGYHSADGNISAAGGHGSNIHGSNIAHGQKVGGFLNLQQQQNLNRAHAGSVSYHGQNNVNTAGNYQTNHYASDQSDVHSGNYDQGNSLLTQYQSQGNVHNIKTAAHFSNAAQNSGANGQYVKINGVQNLGASGQYYNKNAAQSSGQINREYDAQNNLHNVESGVHLINSQNVGAGGQYHSINAADSSGHANGGYVAKNDLNNVDSGVHLISTQNLEAGGQYHSINGVHSFGHIDGGYVAQNNLHNVDSGVHLINSQNLEAGGQYHSINSAQSSGQLDGGYDAKFNTVYHTQGNNQYASENNANFDNAYHSQGNAQFASGASVANQEDLSTGGVYYQNLAANINSGNVYANGYVNTEGLIKGNKNLYTGGVQDAKSYQTVTLAHGVNDQINLHNTGSNYQYQNNLENVKGTTAYQVNNGLAGFSTTAYEGGFNGANYNQYSFSDENKGPSKPNVNIVGGGYSAVGYGAHTNNGANIQLAIPVISETPAAPAAPAITSIPTVTSVPFPNTHSTTFHKGGVVANIPELQYKIHSHGEFGLQNVTNYASIVSSTPSPFVTSTIPSSHDIVQSYAQSGGYIYNKPSVGFEEVPVGVSSFKPPVTVQQNVYVSSTPKPFIFDTKEGYVYSKPAVTFEEKPITPLVYPQIVSSTLEPIIDTVKQGYVYEKPAIHFKETPINPQIYVSSTTRPDGYIYNKPTVSSTPKPEINIGNQGYVYEKPTIKFEEKPVITQGYVYEKPSIAFEERPQVFVLSTPKPAIAQQGYVHNKQSVTFNETPVTYSTPSPTITSYQTFNKLEQNEYQSTPVISSYSDATPKPVVTYEQKPQVFVSTTPLTSTVEHGYNYNKPNVKFELSQPEIISKFHISGAKSNSYNYHSNENTGGYYYDKPKVVFEDQPAISKFTVNEGKSNTYNYHANQNFNTGGYHYERPSVVFEEKPLVVSQPVVELYKQPQLLSTYSYQKPHVYNTEYQAPKTPYTYQNVALQSIGYKKPVQPEVTYIPSTTYSPQIIQQYQTTGFGYGQVNTYNNAKQNFVSTGSKCNWCNNLKAKYNYPKPTIRFEDSPQQIGYAYPKPQVLVEEQPKVGYTYPKPEIKFEENPKTYITPKPIIVEEKSTGYTYPQPQIKFEETPKTYITPKPIIVKDKSIGYTYQKPEIKFEETPIYSTPKPGYNYPKPAIVFEEKPKPAVVSSFSYVAPQPKPVVVSQETPAIVSNYNYITPTTEKPFVVGYEYPKPQVPFVEQPRPFVTYENQVPVVEEPFVKKTAYVTGQNTEAKQGVVVENYHYQVPQVVQTYVQSTPRPTFVSTLKSIAAKKLEPVTPASVYVYDSRLTPTPQPDFSYVSSTETRYQEPKIQFVSTTSRPVSKFSFSSLDDQYQYNQYQQEIKLDTHQPAQLYLPVTSTELPEVSTLAKEYLPVRIRSKAPVKQYLPVEPTREYLPVRQRVKVVSSTLETPSKEYLPAPQPTREYLPSRQRVKVVTSTELPGIKIKPARIVESYIAPQKEYLPAKEYLPERVTTPAREYLPITTPAKEYLPGTTPAREYLPVRQRVRVTSTTAAPEVTTLSREYLPSKQRVRLTSTVAPIVTPVRTIIKQNDAHPLLSAKLGAQCTCISPSLKLRKNQKLLIVTTDEEDGEDSYDNEGNVVDNYSFEPEKVVEITPTPEVYVQSSARANQYLPPARYEVKKRVRVRPTNNPVTEVSEIFLKKDVTPSYEGRDVKPSDTEILSAVKTGLKLVKQAAIEGAKEGTEETLSKNFDRYGPGGLRSRSERLQGTIDCQRAGLFRHPTQCNKFYSCRWDCTKKKFTLHVFNCPVHLTFDDSMGACNWPSQGPACVDGTLITSE